VKSDAALCRQSRLSVHRPRFARAHRCAHPGLRLLLALGVPYAVALGVIVAILDLIPLAGATIAAIIIGTVAFLHSITAGIVVVIFFVAEPFLASMMALATSLGMSAMR